MLQCKVCTVELFDSVSPLTGLIAILPTARDIVTTEAEDGQYESELLNSDPEYSEEPSESAESPSASGTASPSASGTASAFSHTDTEQPGKDTKQGETESDSAVTAWMRPDRISFDGEQAPFVIPDGDDVTWYKIGEDAGGATTIAA